jgi:hypothetical protein
VYSRQIRFFAEELLKEFIILYVAGLRRVPLGASAGVSASQFYGSLLETLVYLELYKQNSWAAEYVTLLHFRDTQKREVDMVLERSGGGIVGVEVKAPASRITAGRMVGAGTTGTEFASRAGSYRVAGTSGIRAAITCWRARLMP